MLALRSLSRSGLRLSKSASPALFRPAVSTLVAPRFFSSGEKKSIDEEEDDSQPADLSSFAGKYANEIKTALTVGGGSVVFYGISKLFYDITLSFMSLTPAISLKYGFWGGMITAASTSSLFYSFDKAVVAKVSDMS